MGKLFKLRMLKTVWLIKVFYAFEFVDPYMRRTAVASIAAGLASALRAFSNRVMFFSHK